MLFILEWVEKKLKMMKLIFSRLRHYTRSYYVVNPGIGHLAALKLDLKKNKRHYDLI